MVLDPLYIAAVLSACVLVCELLVRHTWVRHGGTALSVIVLAAILANLGLLPAGSPPEAPVPIYEGIFAYLAPLSIFWLLLGVNLRQILRAGGPMLAMFTVGAVGTALGVWVAFGLVSTGPLGTWGHAIGGMFAATYTGGSVNFNAVALHYDIMREGTLYAGTIVVDNILTAVWMVATLAIPRLMRAGPAAALQPTTGVSEDTESLHPIDLAIMLGAGTAALWVANALAELFAGSGVTVPPILLVTGFALLAAQVPAVGRLRGAKILGMFSVYLFLAVIGAFCDVGALAEVGSVAVLLLVLAATTIAIHGALTFGVAKALRWDPDMAAVASQANVGGGTSALALARSLGRDDLVLPAILVGSLGNGLGTFLGFFVAGMLA